MRRLEVGERVRFADGSEWVVYRVGHGSASVKCTLGTPGAVRKRLVEFASGRTLLVEDARAGAYRVGERLEISPRSFVEHMVARSEDAAGASG